MKKSFVTLVALMGLTVVTACGTIQGVASDTYGATKFVARQIGGSD